MIKSIVNFFKSFHPRYCDRCKTIHPKPNYEKFMDDLADQTAKAMKEIEDERIINGVDKGQ